MARRKGRILAFQALYSWDISSAPLADLLDFPWLSEEEKSKISEDVLVFARLLIGGTIENSQKIDETIKAFLNNWDFNRLGRVDLAILRISTYSVLFQSSIHPNIVIDEAIMLCKEFGADESYKFVNAVLDSIRKNVEKKI